MRTIIYRKLQPEDYAQVSDMLADVWQFDKYLGDTQTLARAGYAFWYSYLVRQNYAEVAECGGKILGVLLGHCASLPFPSEHKNWEDESERRLHAFSHSGEGRKFYKVQKRTAKYEKRLLKPYNGSFDAELVLFATAPSARGLGVGKELLSRFNAFLAQQDAHRVFLLTDSFCSYGFYDNLGYRRRAQVRGKLGVEEPGKPFYFYLYSYEV